MADSMKTPFDHHATLDELAGVGRNRRFDKTVDDEGNEEVEVICRRRNPSTTGDHDKYIEIPLAKPSRAFYFGDRNVYDQEARRFDQEERERILNTDQFPNNLKVFDELKRACHRGFVIPFIGAGMSKSAGLPEWREYLLSKCGDAGLAPEAMRERLDKGEYEGVMNDIVEKLTVNVFERDFERDFTLPEQITGAVTLLPSLFDCSVVTTNFDRVLERVYELDGKSFAEKCTGRGSTNAFFRAIPAGERYLLKLHGNIDNAADRVLNTAEYNAAYGSDVNVIMTSPLPRILDRLFSSYSLLFLGCSLSADRTIQTFMRVVSDRKRDTLPRHYALLPSPGDDERRRAINQRLADANITPLWYPHGEHERVQETLQLLLD